MARIKNLLKGVRERFPELSHLKIDIAYGQPGKNYYEGTEELRRGERYRILIGPELKRKDVKYKKVLIAHGLQHIVNDIKRNPVENRRDGELYRKSLVYRKQQEELTDLWIALRGFPEIFEFNRDFDAVGLSPEEINFDFGYLRK